MIGPQDITRWAESIYDDFLRSIIEGRDFFQHPPRRDRLGRVPAAGDATAFLAAASPLWEGSKQMRGTGYTVILESHNRRSRNTQNEPVAVEIQTEADYLSLLQKETEVRHFREDVALILRHHAVTRTVLQSKPRIVVAHQGAWAGILEVIDHLCHHPRPGCFVRALPVSVHTKFIEAHQSGIEALLAVMPESGFDPSKHSFEERCGFARDESSIRGRFLCPLLQASVGFPVADLELRIHEWARLHLPADARIIACENKANFLALPPMPNTLALWGAGGAATGHFPLLPWLGTQKFVYWGDLDPSGIAILASLRGHFPGVRSIMMDAATLVTHADALGNAKHSSSSIPKERLTPGEVAALAAIENPPRGIEQEKLLFRECMQTIESAFV
jgi:hypothetical protein